MFAWWSTVYLVLQCFSLSLIRLLSSIQWRFNSHLGLLCVRLNVANFLGSTWCMILSALPHVEVMVATGPHQLSLGQLSDSLIHFASMTSDLLPCPTIELISSRIRSCPCRWFLSSSSALVSAPTSFLSRLQSLWLQRQELPGSAAFQSNLSRLFASKLRPLIKVEFVLLYEGNQNSANRYSCQTSLLDFFFLQSPTWTWKQRHSRHSYSLVVLEYS